MRKLAILLLLAATAFAQAPKATLSTPPDPNAQKARTLLKQAIEALGGPAWLNAKDMQQEGRSYSYNHGSPTGMGVLFWRFWKYPDKDRIELTKQRDVVYIYNGDKGYEITFKGTAAMDPVDLKNYIRRREHSLETVLRAWLPDPSTALFYDGPAMAQQKYTDKVSLLNAKNDAVTLYLDRDTHLPVKTEFEWRAPDRLKDVENEIFDNWRLEQGVMTPHSTMRMHNGEITNQRFITNVKYGQAFPDKMFQATVNFTPNRPDHPE